MWPRDQRPKHLQSKEIVNSLSLGKLLQYKEHYEKEAEKKGLGSAVFGRDTKIKKTKYKKMTDNGQTKLHPARFARLPLVPPKKYWRHVPKRRGNIFRHFPVAHYGVEGQVAETTYVRMHDRQVPVELDLFTKVPSEKDCFAAMRLQQGVVNYAIGMHSIWPTDYSPLVIIKVLVENRWGESVTDDEKTKSEVVKKFFTRLSERTAAGPSGVSRRLIMSSVEPSGTELWSCRSRGWWTGAAAGSRRRAEGRGCSKARARAQVLSRGSLVRRSHQGAGD